MHGNMKVKDNEGTWGTEIRLHSFLASTLSGCEWSTSRSGLFTPRGTARKPLFKKGNNFLMLRLQ